MGFPGAARSQTSVGVEVGGGATGVLVEGLGRGVELPAGLFVDCCVLVTVVVCAAT